MLIIVFFAFLKLAQTVIITDVLDSNAIRYTHSQSIANIPGTYVTVSFLVRNSPNITYTFAQASFDSFNNTFPTSQQLFKVNPKDRPQIDLQAINSCRKQYINLLVPSSSANTIFITIYNMDPFTRRQDIYFELQILDNQLSKNCAPCISGNLNPTQCKCDPCNIGFQGSDCSRRMLLLSLQYQIKRTLSSGQFAYFKVLKQQGYISVTVSTDSNDIEVYFQQLQYQNQVPSYLNSLKYYSTIGRFSVKSDNDLVLMVSLQNYDLGIAIMNYQSSSTNISIKYAKTTKMDTVAIILAVLGGLLGLAILISLIYLAYVMLRKRNQIVYVNDQPHLQAVNNADKLNQQEIQKYFPEFTMFSLNKSDLSQQTSLQDLIINDKDNNIKNQTDCAICICPIEINQKIRAVYCKHIFHSVCLISWFKKQRNCPYCRQDFSKTNTNKFYDKLLKQTNQNSLQGLQLAKAIMKSGGSTLKFKSVPKVIQDIQ